MFRRLKSGEYFRLSININLRNAKDSSIYWLFIKDNGEESGDEFWRLLSDAEADKGSRVCYFVLSPLETKHYG